MGANAGHVKSAGAATPKGAGPGNLAGAKTLDGRSKLVLFFKPNFEALEITLFFRLFFGTVRVFTCAFSDKNHQFSSILFLSELFSR